MELFEVRKLAMDLKTEEVVVYTLFEHHSRKVQSTSSGNPYWHNDDYELRPGDVVIDEAHYCLMVRGEEDVRDSWCGNFATREDVIRHIEYYLRGEILYVVSDDETPVCV